MRTIHFSNKIKILLWGVALVGFLLLAGTSITLTTTSDGDAVVFNELLASNGLGPADEDGDFSDWVEIYNPTGRALNLSGYSLTDDPTLPEKWRFPNITLPAGEYLLLFASGKNRQPVDGQQPLHTNFRLRKSGDFLGLYSILDQQFSDIIAPRFPPQFRDVSFGRVNGDWAYLGIPTPGGPNNKLQTWRSVAEPVRFSVERGFFNAPFSVELSTATPGAAIRYTTDGSPPTETHGQNYSGPIAINSTTLLRAVAFKAGLLPSHTDTHSYIFIEDVLNQPAAPPGFPDNWGTHKENFKQFVAGTPVKPDYEMDPDIVNNPRYRETLIAGLQAIPSLSLVTDMQHFTDLYGNPQERGLPWERPVSVELIVPDSSNARPDFQINAGLRIQGGVGRKAFIPKHSFRLFFRNQYGAGKLNYPFFPNSPVTEFDTLVLRGGVNRSYVGTFAQKKTTYLRDEWLRASQIEMSGLSPHGAFVHLYINGLYWGLYNVIERPDAAFTSAHLGGDEEDWLAINHGGPVDGPDKELVKLIELYRAINDPALTPQEREAYRTQVHSLVDVNQFSDFIILNWFAGNQDWGENNWYIGKQSPSGKINYFSWDGEKIFFDGAELYLGRANASRPNVVIPLFNLLLDDPDFRMNFADRLYKHLFNSGTLTDANATARWQALSHTIEQAIVGESARWGDVRYAKPITQDDWFTANRLVIEQLDGNANKLIALTRQAGFYPEIDPPTFSQQGGQVKPGFEVTLTAPQGKIYYTTNGIDPRRAGGGIAPEARLYRGPVTISGALRLKSRALDGPTWSALNQADFQVAAQAGRLQMSEIMYNPPEGAALEFIELVNTGNAGLPLANAGFTGIDFTFPANRPLLAPGERVVLVSNAAAFAERYPAVSIDGEYQGQLSNAGETILLQNADGTPLLSVTFDDDRGWPLSADGRGDSLHLLNLAGSPNNPKHWRGGPPSPGTKSAP